jgi:hypothetical protein
MSSSLKRNLIAALLLGSCLSAQAQDVPPKEDLAFNLETYTTTPRSYSPILGKITFDPRVTNLLEGTLHLQIKDAEVVVLQMQIPDLAVAGTLYESAILIPPLPPSGAKGLNVDARFVMEDREIVLSSSDSISNDLSLLITPANQRGMLVGIVVEGKDDPKTANLNFLSEALKFDRYANQPKAWVQSAGGTPNLVTMQSGTFRTAHATLEPSVIPTEPLSLCSFDVLAVADGGLGKLQENQLAAMIQWVKAGGSLCIVPDGVLSAMHTSFLTDLLKEYDDPPPMILNELRELAYDSGVLKTSLGLGRVVILPPTGRLGGESVDEGKLSFEQCQDFAGFLWKVRSEHQQFNEKWDFEPTPPTKEQILYGMDSNEPAVATLTGISEATEQLMPRNVRMVPLSLVGLLLAAYVFLVGPGDYLLLGLLKARRFTWVVFPLVTAGFTIAMVALSNHFMSTSETGGSIEVYDVIGSGEVVRKTTLDLDFFAAPRDVEEKAKAELMAPIDIRASVYDYQGGGLVFDDDGNPIPNRFRQSVMFSGEDSYLEGRVPNSYTRYRSVKQWQPELTRYFSIENSTAPNLGFDWDNPGEIWTKAGRRKLRAAVSKYPRQLGLRILNRSQQFAVTDLPMAGVVTDQSGYPFGPQTYYDDYLDLISDLSAPTANFFRYVSAISPNGGSNFEDLAMLDTSDSSQWLLVASWVEDDTQVIYRRLYNFPDASELNDVEAK